MHDRNGKPLAIGDVVTLTGEITRVYPDADSCNVVIEHKRLDGTTEGFTFTAKNLEKVEGAPLWKEEDPAA